MKLLSNFPSINNFNLLYRDHLKYSDVTWITAHNAFASTGEGWQIYKQQSLTLEQMFSYGVRSFMIDIHYYGNSQLSLCHIGCAVTFVQKGSAASSLLSYLNRIKKLLDNDHDAIITLHLEDHSKNSTDIINTFELSGLKSTLLKDNPNNDNITLGFLRENNVRLIVFSDYQKERVETSFETKPGILPTIFYKETAFGSTTFKDCNERINDFRAEYDDTSIKLFVHNHFSKVSIGSHAESNNYEAIVNTVNPCIAQGLYPNFITVDFVEEGKFGGARRIVEDLMNIHNTNQDIKNLELSGNATIEVKSEYNEL